jgi:aminomethyltransferase
MSKEYAVNMWELLLKAGEKYGLIPCGLGARDTLRLEAAMPLYGHEMDENTNPFEAELGFAVKMNKPDFVGKSALENISLSKRRVGIKVIDRGIVREHQDIYCGDKLVGKTTSGTFCPFLESALAMAMVDIPYTNIGTLLEVDVRGRRVPVKVVSLPFYKK